MLTFSVGHESINAEEKSVADASNHSLLSIVSDVVAPLEAVGWLVPPRLVHHARDISSTRRSPIREPSHPRSSEWVIGCTAYDFVILVCISRLLVIVSECRRED